MSDTIRVWTRRELESAAQEEPEGTTMLRVPVSPKLLLLLIEWHEANGSERIEIASAFGDPLACELRFFKRDAL